MKLQKTNLNISHIKQDLTGKRIGTTVRHMVKKQEKQNLINSNSYSQAQRPLPTN